MKRLLFIGFLLLLSLAACHTPTHKAKRMVARAERLADTLPDSALRLIDSVLRMPVGFGERQRMDMALLQGEVLFRDAALDDDDFLDSVATSPELERAANYYAKKKQYDKAAHAALYSGYVQQHYNEKESAMQSFKDAEHYGGLVGDSLTMARAQYKMGKLLYDDGMEQEALAMLKAANIGLGNCYEDKAIVQNMMAVCYIIQGDFENSDKYLKQSLLLSEKFGSVKVRRKTLNNFAVSYRLQEKYNQAINCLRQIAENQNLSETDMLLLYLNLGKTFSVQGEMDSAAVYYQRLDSILPFANAKNETVLSAYGALSRFAESQGNKDLTLQYREFHEKLLYDVMKQQKDQAVYHIQLQYDYESLQNTMNQKLIRKQRFITIFGIFAIIGLTALAISQIRLAKTRKQEAETRARLFHFMQQNKELSQKSEEQEQRQVYLKQKHIESEQAYEELLEEKMKQEHIAAEYGEKLSLALKKEQSVMLRLHLFLENKGDEELLKKLEKSVFGKQAHLDAMMETVDRLYPQLREIVKQEDFGLDEHEQMDVIMSYFNISRQDEALLLGKTTDMIDKIRNRSRKKIQSASEDTQLPKTR